MLVLTRKVEEVIQIGRDITVTVIAVDGDRVRLGINAPKDMRIYRKELLEETKDANVAASKAAPLKLSFKKPTGEGS